MNTKYRINKIYHYFLVLCVALVFAGCTQSANDGFNITYSHQVQSTYSEYSDVSLSYDDSTITTSKAASKAASKTSSKGQKQQSDKVVSSRVESRAASNIASKSHSGQTQYVQTSSTTGYYDALGSLVVQDAIDVGNIRESEGGRIVDLTLENQSLYAMTENLCYEYNSKTEEFVSCGVKARSSNDRLEFNGKQVYIDNGKLFVLSDGQSVKKRVGLDDDVYQIKIYNEKVYILAACRSGSEYNIGLYVTNDLKTFKRAVKMKWDEPAYSFCCGQGCYYFGFAADADGCAKVLKAVE